MHARENMLRFVDTIVTGKVFHEKDFELHARH